MEELDVLNFYESNKCCIANFDGDIAKITNPNTVGLRISGRGSAGLQQLSTKFPRLEYIRLDTESREVGGAKVIADICRFRNLKYVGLADGIAEGISKSVVGLTNLPSLKSFLITGKHIVDVPPELYQIRNVMELRLRIGPADLPNGISALEKLKRLDLSLSKINRLPKDLVKLPITWLSIIGVSNAVGQLPELPPRLISLDASGCKLTRIPAGWLVHSNLANLALNNAGLEEFPSDLTGLPALCNLWMQSNLITNVPAIHLSTPSRVTSIDVLDNPIRSIAEESKPLIADKILVISDPR